VWHQYTVRVPGGKRDGLRDHLQGLGIGCAVFYPTGMHQQLPYAKGRPSLPVCEAAGQQVLSLPMSPHLTAAQQAKVASAIRAYFAA
jgi:dTDP-4-amino-4,6-dideoxygalactose transaminase